MTAETLYKPRGAGHSAPRGKRSYKSPGDPLLDAFEGWLNLSNDKGTDWFFKKALEMMPDMRGRTSDEVGAILAAFSGHKNIYSAGIFLSAAYNLMDTDDIVFDDRSGIDIQLLGYKLKEGKRLIVASDAGFRVAEDSEGIVVNYGRCDRLGQNSKGMIINYGNAPAFGWLSEGVIINLGETTNLGASSKGLVINHGHVERIGNDIGPVQGLVINTTDLDEGSIWCERLITQAECKEISGLLEFLNGIRAGVSPYKKVDGRDDMFDPKPYSEIFAFLDGLDVKGDVKRILVEAGREL